MEHNCGRGVCTHLGLNRNYSQLSSVVRKHEGEEYSMATAELNRNYKKGLEYYDQGMLSDALAAFQVVIENAPSDCPEARLARFYIGEAHAQLAEENVHRGANTRAEEHMREAVENNPKYPDLRFQLAQVIYENGRVQDAMLEVETALELNPDYAKALLFLGVLAYETGEHQAGLKHIARAVEIEPRYNTEEYKEALAADSKKNHSKCLAMLRELSSTNVDDISFHLQVGKKYYRNAEYDKAVEAFEQAMSIQNNYPDIRNWLGLALMACKNPERALEEFRKAIEINPRFLQAMINAGIACKMIGLVNDAKAYYKSVLELDPLNLEAKERLEEMEID